MRTISLVLICLLLIACDEPKSVLEQIKEQGFVVVATRNSPTTYYSGPQGATGFEYDLAKQFADHLGVDLKIVVPGNFSEVLDMVEQGDVHIAAAGLTVTDQRRQRIRFGPVYQYITQQLVFRKDRRPPRSLRDVSNGTLEVMAHSSHVERLLELKPDYTNLSWHENKNLESEELLTLVYEKLIDYTIADSNEVALNQRFFPELRVAFDVTEPQPLAWAFSYKHDYSLHDEAYRFFSQIKQSGELDSLLERHYGHTENVSYASWHVFMNHVNTRLIRYQNLFEQAGRENDIDWRLLAAMAYQESLWNPKAVSPTGVRGIMMLTRLTAKDLGVSRRTSADQSIDGGARYFRQLINMVPDEIKEPDRTWFALSAYNVGFRHLLDARTITGWRKQNANKWIYVKESLPLLRKKKWYSKVPAGFARGDEPVKYVQNIRAFYDLLVWLTDEKVIVEELQPEKLTKPLVTTAQKEKPALPPSMADIYSTLNSPAL